MLTPFDNLAVGPSPSGSVTENLASLPDFALLALANGTTDINVARMVVQELYLRLELRAWTDIPPGEEDDTVELPAPLDQEDSPVRREREEYETSLLRAYRDSARKSPYGD